jgi:hypothetical protein
MGFTTHRRMAMTALRRRMREDLHLRGVAPKPQPGSLDAVTPLAPYDRRAPDQSREEEIRPYFRSLLHEKQVAEST